MDIRSAAMADYPFLRAHDRHISPQELKSSIAQERILLGTLEDGAAGWLRWNLFWDNTPFLNMLCLLEENRGKGYGRQLVSCWEERMRRAGFPLVMTSSRSDEQAQHFYRRLGYADSGCLLLPGEPLELIFVKQLEETLGERPCKSEPF